MNIELEISLYRYFVIAITRVHIREVARNFEKDDLTAEKMLTTNQDHSIYAWQTEHSRNVTSARYGLNSAYSGWLQLELLTEYCRVSTAWHRFLNLTEDAIREGNDEDCIDSGSAIDSEKAGLKTNTWETNIEELNASQSDINEPSEQVVGVIDEDSKYDKFYCDSKPWLRLEQEGYDEWRAAWDASSKELSIELSIRSAEASDVEREEIDLEPLPFCEPDFESLFLELDSETLSQRLNLEPPSHELNFEPPFQNHDSKLALQDFDTEPLPQRLEEMRSISDVI